MSVRIAVIEFPGTNCERETFRAVARAGMEPIRFRWNQDPGLLDSCDGYVIGGGFSYEDRSRSGIIAALDPIMDILRKEDEVGKPILGICNGAQILLESGIVPGLRDHRPGGALASNKRIVDSAILGTGFYNAWVNIRDTGGDGAFTGCFDAKQVLAIPAAHAEGRFVIPRSLLDALYRADIPTLRYCDAQGNIIPSFPVNPNGSVDNLAAIGNLRGNALAIMPHPERTRGGDVIFTSMRTWIEHPRLRQPVNLLPYEGIATDREEVHVNAPGAKELLVSTIITDNTAISVEQALRNRGLGVQVRRAVHWELIPDERYTPEAFGHAVETACASGELFNKNKEFLLDRPPAADRHLLVRSPAEDDSDGLKAHQVLESRFALSSIKSIRHGILWMLTADADQDRSVIDQALMTNIFNNPYSHRRYSHGSRS
jgi:phosphoribosylformylglycinamidine synthase